MPHRTPMKPPSEKMLVVLRELAKPGAFAHYMRYMGRFNESAYYFVDATMRRCTREIGGLRARELVEYFDVNTFGDHKVRISAAGKKYIRQFRRRSLVAKARASDRGAGAIR